MSSRFSAHGYDDHPLSSPRSLVDLSPSSRSRTRARSGSLGAEDPTIPTHTPTSERSNIRINTDLTTPARTTNTTTAKSEDDLRRPTTTANVRSSHARSTSISAPTTAVETCPPERPGFSGMLVDRPPTTNHLRPQDRADLIRKSRKLTQLFGETPCPQSVTPPSLPVRVSSEALLDSRTGRHSPRPIWAPRPSMRSADSIDNNIHDRLVLPSPIDALSISDLSLAGTAGAKAGDSRTGAADVTASFIDLHDDDKRPIPFFPHSLPPSPQRSSLDLTDSMLYTRTPEEDRRRRREKLAKLHRFLGSRVPTSLVLGFSASEDNLPALDPTVDNVRTTRHNRRRSSSATETRTNWFGPDDRMKEELDEREKAINVRRALKMEKMFGVQPPQTLYHTRHSPRPTDRVHSTERLSRHHSEREAVRPATRKNINQGSYLNKDGKQRASSHSRAHSESIPLLDPVAVAGSSSGKRASAVYMHYRYSLDSLSDIIDRDDRESLAELHSILTNDQSGSDRSGSTPVPRDDGDGDGDDARTIRSERRRSLPTRSRSSTVSLASQFSLGSPSPERTSFQTRRKQAAKLTHFFGVDYRDLIGDILESIERYVEEESHRGTLHPEEIKDLVVKLRRLKTKRR